jgi:hypothetical protein
MSLHNEDVINTNRVSLYKRQSKSDKIKLDVYTLNKKINENKKLDFLKNFKLISMSLFALAIIMIISFKL